MEESLRESLREHEETAGSGRSQAFALQRKLEAEKAQRVIDISRTTQTHANLLADANDRINRLEVSLPPPFSYAACIVVLFRSCMMVPVAVLPGHVYPQASA